MPTSPGILPLRFHVPLRSYGEAVRSFALDDTSYVLVERISFGRDSPRMSAPKSSTSLSFASLAGVGVAALPAHRCAPRPP